MEIKQKAFVRNRQYFIKISGRPQDEFLPAYGALLTKSTHH